MPTDRPHAQVTVNGRRLRIYTATPERARAVTALAARLRGVPGLDNEKLLRDAANATAGDFDALRRAVERAEREASRATPRPRGKTFRELGEEWTSGKLAEKHPDHVKVKRTASKDEGLLKHLYKTIGEVELAVFSLAHAEQAMAALPETAKSSAQRRHYAQLISKLLRYAVYPCKIIDRSPLPDGFLPKIKNKVPGGWLYPSEDLALLQCAAIPLVRRLAWGFLAREGCRPSEAFALEWSDFDLERGAVKLEKNKTDDPRAWALTPGVPEALKAFRDGQRPKPKPNALVFGALLGERRLAEVFRADLATAGVDRAELHEGTDLRLRMRARDQRATFVTLSLAAGKSEAWIADRTGHRSSTMINRYRRSARMASELGLGELGRLDVAIPELVG